MKPVLTTNYGQLFADDCLEVTKQMEPDSVDCFFADPPFNLKKEYGKGVDDNLTETDYLAWCYQWIDEGVRVLKPGGSFFLYNLPKWNILLAGHLNKTLTFRNWITVELTFSLPIAGRLYPSNYSLLYFVNGPKPKTFNPPRLPLQVCRHCGGEIKDYGGYKSKMNPKGISLSDVWTDIPPVRHAKLMDRILDIATVEGDVVFDPFGGSGTTYAAAELKKRRWIGAEISTAQAILDRFSSIQFDQEHLTALEARKNTLFTPDALALRKKCGHDNSKYRIEQAAEPEYSLFAEVISD
jgi:site-specific DNA-methyltransferase (adenine-specific)